MTNNLPENELLTDVWLGSDASLGRCTFSVVGTFKKAIPEGCEDMTADRWTGSDVMAGRCVSSEMGSKRIFPNGQPPEPIDTQSAQSPASNYSQDQTQDADPDVAALDREGPSAYQREAAAYHADNDGYTARKPPGVVKAVMDWDEAECKARKASAASVLDRTIAEVYEDVADVTLYKITLAALRDSDAERVALIHQAIDMPDWKIRDMIGEVGARLPQEMRQDIAKALLRAG